MLPNIKYVGVYLQEEANSKGKVLENIPLFLSKLSSLHQGLFSRLGDIYARSHQGMNDSWCDLI